MLSFFLDDLFVAARWYRTENHWMSAWWFRGDKEGREFVKKCSLSAPLVYYVAMACIHTAGYADLALKEYDGRDDFLDAYRKEVTTMIKQGHGAMICPCPLGSRMYNEWVQANESAASKTTDRLAKPFMKLLAVLDKSLLPPIQTVSQYMGPIAAQIYREQLEADENTTDDWLQRGAQKQWSEKSVRTAVENLDKWSAVRDMNVYEAGATLDHVTEPQKKQKRDDGNVWRVRTSECVLWQRRLAPKQWTNYLAAESKMKQVCGKKFTSIVRRRFSEPAVEQFDDNVQRMNEFLTLAPEQQQQALDYLVEIK